MSDDAFIVQDKEEDAVLVKRLMELQREAIMGPSILFCSNLFSSDKNEEIQTTLGRLEGEN